MIRLTKLKQTKSTLPTRLHNVKVKWPKKILKVLLKSTVQSMRNQFKMTTKKMKACNATPHS